VLSRRRLDHDGARARLRQTATDGLGGPLGCLDGGDGTELHHDGLSDAGIGRKSRDGQAAAHVGPFRVGRRAARPAAAPAEPVAQELSLIEQLDAHPPERRRHDLDDIRVDQRAGGRLHLGERGIGTALLQEILHPELPREHHGADALVLESGQHGTRFVEAGRDRTVGMVGDTRRLAKGERDHAPPVASRLAGHARRQHAGTADQTE